MLLLGAPAARAEVKPFGSVDCQPSGEVRFCQGDVGTRVKTFDGVPLDVNVTLPKKPAAGADGDYPLIVQLHGYGDDKVGLDEESLVVTARSLAEDGYAVLSYTARGFHESCGSQTSRLADPVGCADGYIRLADSRYEVRDTQHLAGLLADQGLVAPRKVGVVGVSYGGGQAVQLATLRNRIRRADGSYRPWLSPEKRLPMEIAAAVPVAPWTDLVHSLVPNGGTLDYLVTSETDDFTPVGIFKQSFVAGLFALGQTSGFIALPGTDEDADLTTWSTRANAGEPYNGDPLVADIVEELTQNHSAYYLNMDRPPAPVLISNGFTDDLFPVDEALRYANKVRALHPDATISQLYFDFGHPRGSNKPADLANLRDRTRDWLDRYVANDEGVVALDGVEALTQTCPREEPSGGPFHAPTWRELHPGEVRFREGEAQTILSEGGDPRISAAVDPVAAGSNPCVETEASDQEGTATYRLPVVDDGYTLLGSPTVIADLTVTGAGATNTEIAARLWDVAPDGSSQKLVARALYRPDGNGRRVFQLYPNGYKFEPGHTPKLELLGKDPPYARRSNASPFAIEVSNLDFRLPTLEEAGNGEVQEPAELFVPDGGELAPGYGGRDPDPGDASCKGVDTTIFAEPSRAPTRGTPGDDVIVGTPGADDIRGRGGNDLICSRGGDDKVDADDGRDRVFAGGGDDDVTGGAGNDRLAGMRSDDHLDGGEGKDRLIGKRGQDRLIGGEARDFLTGRGGDDVLSGNDGSDELFGNAGDDRLRGGRDSDGCRGGRGRDSLRSCER